MSLQLITQILARAQKMGASDIHLAADEIPFCRLSGELQSMGTDIDATKPKQLSAIIDDVLDEQQKQQLMERGSVDGALSIDDASRYRFNIFRCGGKLSIALRQLENQFRPLNTLGLNDDLYELCDLKDGLVLVAGPTGSGKSTTLATLIDRINQQRKCHIITIEDPIEYVHRNKLSLVSQRQIGVDTGNFAQALVDAVRQDPDVILVGELRDLDTIRTAVMAAETGHLVFA